MTINYLTIRVVFNMTWFNSFRFESYPSIFGPNRSPAHIDILEAGFILAFVILIICYLTVISNTRGKYLVFISLRILLSLIIGILIMISNFGYTWEKASFQVLTPYKPGNNDQILADIKIQIGLRAMNITLLSDKNLPESLKNEQIDYNEQFPWAWDQGRIGFGPQAGILQQTFRKAQFQGVPIPILWIVEYFIIDGEGIRFGRFYRTAGWYTHIAMWTAFPFWILANILMLSGIRYGALMLCITGIAQLLACIFWAFIRNPFPLKIIMNDLLITPQYGSSFFIALFNGLLSLFIGILIIIFDHRFPGETSVFFGLDPLADYEENYMTQNELKKELKNQSSSEVMEMMPPIYDDEISQPMLLFKRRRTILKGQRNVFRTREHSQLIGSDNPLYSNIPVPRRRNIMS